jgi:flagellar motility protein MotE (MotC chaperone)
MLNRYFGVRSGILLGLLCLLVFKLGYTGVLLCRSGSASFNSLWESPSALAGDETQEVDEDLRKGEGPDAYQVTPSQPEAEDPLVALEMKRMQLEQRERRLKEEEERLTELKKEIEEKLSKVTRIQEAVQSDLAQKEAVQNERVKHLIKVYQTMPPRKAAVLVEKLDMDVIIALFSQMKGENVGQILPYVSAEKAAKISEQLAKIGF